jgi:hypothetical protein
MRSKTDKSLSNSRGTTVTKATLETLIDRCDWWSAIFTLMVVIGVAGELVTHVIQTRANKRLIAVQRTEADQLNLEIEKLRNANLKLEQKLSPRSLDQAQQKRISERMSEFKGYQFAVGTSPNSVEGQLLADRISGAISNSGCTVVPSIGHHAYLGITRGVGIITTSDARSKKAAVALAESLTSEGLDTGVSEQIVMPYAERFPANIDEPIRYMVLISVGTKL